MILKGVWPEKVVHTLQVLVLSEHVLVSFASQTLTRPLSLSLIPRQETQ
jgi:hypothetical protein